MERVLARDFSTNERLGVKGSGSMCVSCTLLTCTTDGNARMRSFEETSCSEFASTAIPRMWKVCKAGNILCSKVDGTENYALFGGKGVEVNVWDLEKCTEIWKAKPLESLLLSACDISAQRRPVTSFDFWETPIKAVAEDLDGYTIYLGNGFGDLAAVDMRTDTSN
ncbi:hypothetical protein FNV43_RR00411 [Rhamnella rubrinervis]|uniref:Uncharacterized protein n=1 Tax=Rhamnella rubrinervis TaxID=2594499 RepID=A0A8K0HP39_9ROSA|nr:hypothetical protein FNV43_RR00411 [Rhamnella rubrinervis]